MSSSTKRVRTRWARLGGTAAVASLSVLAMGAGQAVAATSGDVDRSFGTNGVVRTDLGGPDAVSDVAVQADGKIVVVGTSAGKVAVARYTARGALDRTFSRDGKVVTDLGGAQGEAVALDAEGRVVVGADAGGQEAVLRYTRAGVLDPTFGGGDGVWLSTTGGYVRDVLVQPNGKIVTVGLNLLRLKGSGVLDPKFTQPDVSSDGEGYHYVARQANGDYVISSRSDDASAEIRRFTPDGVPAGEFHHSRGDTVGAQSIGVHTLGDKVVMVSEGVYYGSPYYTDDMLGHGQITLEKFLANGNVDPSFGRGGVTIVDTRRWPGAAADTQATASAVTPDGRILVVSPTSVARFTAGGRLDKTFSGDGIAVLRGIGGQPTTAVQPDGKVVVAGDQGGDFLVQRLLG